MIAAGLTRIDDGSERYEYVAKISLHSSSTICYRSRTCEKLPIRFYSPVPLLDALIVSNICSSSNVVELLNVGAVPWSATKRSVNHGGAFWFSQDGGNTSTNCTSHITNCVPYQTSMFNMLKMTQGLSFFSFKWPSPTRDIGQ